jgi:hypothetical protein
MRSFIELRDVREEIACPGCRSPSTLAVDPERGESELHYRLNSLVDRASENGVLVHLLAVAALRRRDPKAYVNPGANLSAADGNQQEADIVALLGSEIWLGEAKTSAKWFTPEQIERDVALAARLRAAHYLMTCLEPIVQEQRRAASAVCEEVGVKLWILEGHSGDLAEVLPQRNRPASG